MAHSWNDDVRLAHVLADNADNLSMDRFGAIDLAIATKPDLSYVTESDEAVEDAIRRHLRTARTRDDVLGEEHGSVQSASGPHERRWIVDPIDGTSNFVRGVPVWATLIALEEAGEIVVGCVSAPALGRRWWASKGGGAFTGKSFMHAREIRCSRVADLADASLSYSSAASWEDIGQASAFAALARRCWRTRGYGDFWSYMLVAEGAVDIAAEPELKVWDMAALDVIVREAGGRFTSLAGEDGPWGANALASNGRLHEAAMAYLGHFPDDGETPADWRDEDHDAEAGPTPGPPGEPSNVRTLDFGRTVGPQDDPS
ncbi:inositol monophosphatase family protein [Aeromicrobium sp. CF4.19]|uniref:inositol monophosphatase family protein n=1 Tax=Aeromicrobium sp. CF4.19 TaxID=3373082 RepID=UPI003EE7402B